MGFAERFFPKSKPQSVREAQASHNASALSAMGRKGAEVTNLNKERQRRENEMYEQVLDERRAAELENIARENSDLYEKE